MNAKIRQFSFTDADYEAAVALRNQIYPDIPSTVEVWKHNDQTRRTDPSYKFFVAESTIGQIQAFVQCSKTNPSSQTLSIGLIGRPDAWSNGIASDLLAEVKKTVAEQSITALVQKVQESDNAKQAFFKDQGFEIVMRYPLSALDVAAFEASLFMEKVAQTKTKGIKVSQMPLNWEHDTSQQKFIHDLDWQLMLDVPHFEPRQKKSLEKFLADEIFHPNAIPNSYFIAWDDVLPVGLTCFVKRGNQTVSTAITGVLRTHRRRGIATALKVASIQFAQSAGYQTILTSNEENNPMYELNRQLGFKKRPAWLDLKLQL
ncbi:MAG: GNAT family N-acetyltransferase [Anaerolineae bacterium]